MLSRFTTPVVATAMAMLAGASMWVSLGTLAVTEADSRFRVVALPPLWVLIVLMLSAGVAARRARLTTDRAWPLALSALVWLPFLPGQVPAAFLLWQGPVEAVVWCAVAIGLMQGLDWSRVPGISRVVADPRSAPWLAASLALIAYLAGARAMSERLPNGDEPHYLMITQSLLLDGDLQIQNNHERADYVSFYANELAPHYVARGLNGQMYSIHAPGLAAYVLPGFALGGYVLASAMTALACALAAGLGWRVAWLLTASSGAAWFATAAVFLTAPFFLHAFTLFPDAPGGALLMVGVWLLVSLDGGARVRSRSLVLTGAALGCLPWMHTRFAVLASAIVLVVTARLLADRSADRWARAAAFLVGPVILGAAWFLFFWTIWGTFSPSAPYGAFVGMQLRNVWPGLQGVLIDQQYGLGPSAPVYVAAIVGVVAMWPRRRLTIEVITAGVGYGVVVAAYDMWWGGFGGPARFLVAALPLAVLPLASAWARGTRAARAGLLMLFLVSGLMLAARLAVDQGSMAYADTFGTDPLLDWVARSVNLAAALPSLRAAEPWRLAALWLLFAGTAAVMTAVVARRRLTVGAEWSLVSLAAALAVMGAAAAAWQVQGSPALAPAKSQLAFVRDWHPDWQSLDLQWRPPYRVSAELLLRRLDVPADRPRPSMPARFAAPPVGAADYELAVEGTQRLRGELIARMGDTDQPAERWRLDDLGADQATLHLRLPVPVHQITVGGDAETLASVRKLSLRVAAFDARARRELAPAHRVARFGRVRAFFLDDNAYAEAAGFWTRGQARTTLVLDGDDQARSPITLRIRSGPVATTVDLAAGDWTERLNLRPQEQHEVTLPAPADGRDPVLSLQTGAMFLPAQHDPRSRDFRHLGVWVELP